MVEETSDPEERKKAVAEGEGAVREKAEGIEGTGK